MPPGDRQGGETKGENRNFHLRFTPMCDGWGGSRSTTGPRTRPDAAGSATMRWTPSSRRRTGPADCSCTRADMHRLERVINSIHRKILDGLTAYEYDTAYTKAS